MNIDARDREWPTCSGNSHEVSYVSSSLRPSRDDLVLFTDQVLDREPRAKCSPKGLHSLLQTIQPVGLPRQRIVFDVVNHRKLIESVHVSSIEDVLVVSTNDGLVMSY